MARGVIRGVFSPMTIMALPRDKEAARRYRPRTDQFVTDNRKEIEAVLGAAQATAHPAGS
jgi:hypothetical protein